MFFFNPLIPLPKSKHDGQHITYDLSFESCVCKNNSSLGYESAMFKKKNNKTTFIYFLYKYKYSIFVLSHP